jgi:hypothetical protein
MRTIVVVGVALLVALSSAAGDETKEPSRLKLVCSFAKDGMTILPAEGEPAAKDANQLLITCDNMRVEPDGGIVLENANIETKDRIFSAPKISLKISHNMDGLPVINLQSPNGGPLNGIKFKSKAKAEQP